MNESITPELRNRTWELEHFYRENGKMALVTRLLRLLWARPEHNASRYIGRLNVDLLNVRTLITLILILEQNPNDGG